MVSAGHLCVCSDEASRGKVSREAFHRSCFSKLRSFLRNRCMVTRGFNATANNKGWEVAIDTMVIDTTFIAAGQSPPLSPSASPGRRAKKPTGGAALPASSVFKGHDVGVAKAHLVLQRGSATDRRVYGPPANWANNHTQHPGRCYLTSRDPDCARLPAG
ncbi:hypothetical protein MRX96_010512 [Rhipicephalus microplus]